MAEYIEREGAEEIFACGKENWKDYEAAACIAALPAADVQPVRHGRNIYDTVPGHCEFKCSLCGAELSTVYGGRNDFGMDGGCLKYCPNCGAKMDGKA